MVERKRGRHNGKFVDLGSWSRAPPFFEIVSRSSSLLFLNGGPKSEIFIIIRGEDGDDDSEESSEESSEEDSSEEEEDGTSSTPAAGQPELGRVEKRDLKRKEAADKQKKAEDEDPDLINPNHVQQKMNISDLNGPRELSRRER